MYTHSGRLLALLSGLALAALLPACGGGGGADGGADNTPEASAAELPELKPPAPGSLGVFGGAILRGSDADLLLVVREDGTKLGIYGTNTPTSFSIAGFLAIGGDWRSGSDPTVYNGKDWGRNGLNVYLDASYDIAMPSLSGTIRSTTETLSFTGGPIPGSTYNFNMPATVAGVAGSWNLTDDEGRAATLNIAADGNLAGQYLGCSVTGVVKPSDSGKNLLNLGLSFDKASCPENPYLLDLPHHGFVLAYPLTAGGTQLIVWAETNNGIDFSKVLAAGRR
jgi:hypothetical protein